MYAGCRTRQIDSLKGGWRGVRRSYTVGILARRATAMALAADDVHVVCHSVRVTYGSVDHGRGRYAIRGRRHRAVRIEAKGSVRQESPVRDRSIGVKRWRVQDDGGRIRVKRSRAVIVLGCGWVGVVSCAGVDSKEVTLGNAAGTLHVAGEASAREIGRRSGRERRSDAYRVGDLL